MKKNIIGIIAIAVLGGLVASGCTYSQGKIQAVDVSEGIGSQQATDSKSTEVIVEGEEEAIAPPSGAATDDGTPLSDEPTGDTNQEPSEGNFAAGTGGAIQKFVSGDASVMQEPAKQLAAAIDALPAEVKSVELLSDHRTIIITFTKPVDVQSVIQNKSIAFFVAPILFPVPLKGALAAGLTSSPASSDTILFVLDESEKEVHVHNTGSTWIFAPYTLKVYGLDSSDPSKAVKDADGAAMANEYEHAFICGNGTDSASLTFVDDCNLL